MTESHLEAQLRLMLMVAEQEGRVPPWEQEYAFHGERRWRFDFAWPEQRVAVEVEGGIWSNGRHTRGSGFEDDCEKYNEAAVDGWRVLRVTSSMIDEGLDGRLMSWLESALVS